MSLDKLLEFSELGSYCQFDLFGTECSHYQLAEHIDMPSDAQRIDKIKCLIGNGNSDRILMSHDIHTKHRLVANFVFSTFYSFLSMKSQLKSTLFSDQLWRSWLCSHNQ